MNKLKTQYYIQMKQPEEHNYGQLTNPWYDKEEAIKFVKEQNHGNLDMRVVKVEREVILDK